MPDPILKNAVKVPGGLQGATSIQKDSQLSGNLYSSPTTNEKDQDTPDILKDAVRVSDNHFKFDKTKDDYIAEVKQIAEKYVDDYKKVTGDMYITDKEKTDRVTEIDATIKNLKREMDSYESDLRNVDLRLGRKTKAIGGIRGAKEAIQNLSNEKKALKAEVREVTPEIKKEIEEGYGIFNGLKDADLKEKYGDHFLNKAYNSVINDKLEILDKKRLEEKSPETDLSWAAIKYAGKDEKKTSKKEADIPKEDLDKVWSNATNKKEYLNGDVNKRRQMIFQEAKKIAATKEDVEDKDALAHKIAGSLLKKFAFSEDGNMTIEGVQLFNEYMLNQVNDLIDYYESAIGPGVIFNMDTTDPWRNVADQKRQLNGKSPYDQDFYKNSPASLPLSEKNKKYGKENVNAWLTNTTRDLNQLFKVREQLSEISEIPLARRGIRDVGKGFKSVDARDMLIGLPQMADALNITGIAKRLEKGESITLPEELALKAYATLGYANNYDTQGNWFKATAGAMQMIPYMAEFAYTGGAFTATKEAFGAGLKPVMRKILAKKSGKFATKIADLTTLNIARVSGAAAQAALLPQMYIQSTAENIRPNIVLAPGMDDATFELQKNTGDSFGKGLAKGYMSAFTEMAFERSGQYLMKAIPGAGKAANFAKRKLTGKDFIERKILDDFMKMKGIKAITDMNQYITRNKLGWDGVFEEYLEELGGYFTDRVIQGKSAQSKDFWDDQLTTFMTVGLFGVPMYAANVTNAFTQGKDVKFTMTDTESNEEKEVTLSRPVYQDLMDVLEKRDGVYIDSDAFQKFIDKHGEGMSQEQFDLVTSLTINEGKNRILEETKKQGFNREEDWKDDFDPNIFEDEKSELTEEEIKIRDEENKRITEKYKDLADNGLLVKENQNGQYLEPDKESIDYLHAEVAKQLSEKVELDKYGNRVNVTPDIEKLQRQVDVLHKYQNKFHNQKTNFKDLSIEDKHKRLEIDLDRGEKLSGTASHVTNRKFQVKLSDGRIVDAFYNVNLDQKDNEKANQAVLQNQKLSLELEEWESWNPNLEIGKKIEGIIIPYFDKINVKLEDGTVIGSVQITDFNEKRRKDRDLERKEKEIVENLKKSASEFFTGAAIFSGGINRVVDQGEKDELGKKFIQMVKDAGDWGGIQIEKAFEKLLDFIRSLDTIDDEQKGFLIALAHDNRDKVEKAIAEQQLKAKGFAKEAKELKVDDLEIPEMHGVALSGSNKTDALLQGFAPLWVAIAENTNTTKEIVERKFYLLAKQEGVLSNFENEALFSQYLGSLLGRDEVTDQIVDMLRKSTIGSAVSLFANYNNMYLAKQYGYIFNKGKLTRTLLNPSQKYDEFRESFFNNAKNYTWNGYTGYDAIKRRIYVHVEEMNNRFRNKNQDWEYYDNQSTEKREELRREQHNSDISLLSEITGISKDIWSQYFSSQTAETKAKSSRESANEAEFTTYDNLLKYDTWRGNHRRIQSNIAFNLWYQTIKSPNFELAFNNFFTIGNEQTGALSNLYKLSTAITSVDEIGLSGNDIKGDRFNSFMQSSNISDIAKSITQSQVKNHIVDYYRSKGIEMELSYINGIHNLDENKGKKGTQTVGMSNEDLWLVQLQAFLEGEEVYPHWIGQFGDKPSLTIVDAPKISNLTEEQLQSMRKRFPEFDNAVKWFETEYKPFLSSFLPSLSHEKIQEFIYNFANNIAATNEIFFGKKDSYTSLIDMVKRGGSSNSPGIKMNEFVANGVGETFQFALIDDKLGNWEMFDGVEFMTGEYAERMQVSMGTILSKANQDEYKVLSSVKALTSFIDPETGLRGLTKTNRLNIDILANAFPGSKFEQLRDLMNEKGVDVASFTSGTKKFEKAKNNKERIDASIKMWEDDGSLKKKIDIPENGIVTRLTKHVYIQQDLRHSSIPTSTKMPIQTLSNTLILDNGPAVSNLINKLQNKVMIEMVKEFEGKAMDDVKLEWLKEAVNQHSQPEIFDMLEAGITPYEPALANFLRKMLAGTLTRKALEMPINRLTTQEIPDPDGLLEGRRSWSGTYSTGEKEWKADVILLPDIAANVTGARYEDAQFEGDIDGALNQVLQRREYYSDLFDEYGNIMWWEIVARNGVIPGEYIISTRVPADDLHSHTVGRLKHKISGGNFTMLDNESQLASGSDFDGDQRFNQVFFKDKNGKIILDNSKEGIANQIMQMIAIDYTKPKFDAKIKAAINTKLYDDIVKRVREREGITENQFSFMDPRGFDKARRENMTGVKMKGMLTDAVTIYGLLAHLNIKFNRSIVLQTGKSKISLTGFAADPQGKLKLHLANFLNLAFDNAADPKIEDIGINEITSNMFVIALLGNKNLDTKNDKAIIKHIEQVVKYFTSPEMRAFTSAMRRQNGGMYSVNMKDLEIKFKRDFEGDLPGQIIEFYKLSQELPELRRFYNLTQRASGSSVEIQTDKALYDDIRVNSKEKFKLIDVKPLFNERGEPITEFKSAKTALEISDMYIYQDSWIHTPVGLEIRSALLNKFNKKKRFFVNELKSIDYALSNIATLRAIGVRQSASNLEKELLANIDKYRKKYPDNKFLQTIQKVYRNGKFRLEIAPDYRQAKIGEKNLKQIREDFDSLPGELQDKFAAHTVYQFGTTTSTYGGSYYSLLGTDFRISLSRKAQNELYDWQVNNISSIDKLQMMNWVLRASRVQEFKDKSQIANPSYANYYDYQSLANIATPISYDTLEGVTGVTNANEYIEYAENHQFSAQSLRDELNSRYGLNIKSVTKELVPAANRLMSDLEREAKATFPVYPKSNESPKSMLDSDTMGEALATEDPELQKFIFDKLRKMYPGVVFFSSREEFMDFVHKNGGNGREINPHALGHAFKNAVFVDTNKAVQSTVFHEHAHIYWDALPSDHPVKVKLSNLYKEKFPESTDAEIEEMIIGDIGRAGYKLADVKMNGSALQKFVELLKEFWRAVKQIFGASSKTDLVQDMAYSIWNNSDNINPSTNHGEAIVKNMISYNFKKEEIPNFEGDTHTHYIGSKPIPSATSVIKASLSEQFDPIIKAKAAMAKDLKIYRGLSKEKWSAEEARTESDAIQKLWSEDVPENGTFIHSVAESVFSKEPIVITQEDIESNFGKGELATEEYRLLKNDFYDMKDDILDAYPNAKFITEPHLISKKYRIGGFADLVVDIGNNQLLVFDFKTTEKEFAMDDMTPLPEYKKQFGTLKAPFQNIPNSKYSQHMLQLNMYSNMLEEQEDPKAEPIKKTIETDELTPDERAAVEWVNSLNASEQSQEQFVQDKRYTLVKKLQNEGKITRDSNNNAAESFTPKMVQKEITVKQKNKVLKTRIVPIIVKRGKDNIIENARIGNWVKIPRNDKTENITDRLMQMNYLKRQNVEKIYPDFEKTLRDQNTPEYLIRDMLTAYHFMNLYTKDIMNFNKDEIGDIRNEGEKSLYAKLTTSEDAGGLGYSLEDLNGKTSMTSEELFFLAINNIAKSAYTDEKRNELFKEIEVSARYKAFPNENAPATKWFKLDDKIVHEVGLRDLEVGDEVMRVYQIRRRSGREPIDTYHYIVKSIDIKRRKVTVENEDTGDINELSLESVRNGLYKYESETPKGVKPVDFVPRYNYEKESILERHWNPGFRVGDISETREGEIDNEVKTRHIKKVWKFFKNNPSWATIQEFLNEEENVTNLYKEFSVLSEKIEPVAQFIKFMREEAMNHFMAGSISRENREVGANPKHILPQTLNLYYILTNHKDQVWNDFDRVQGIRGNMTPRMIEQRFVPLNLFTTQTEGETKKYMQESFLMNRELERFTGKIDFDIATTESQGVRYWKRPNEVNAEDHPIEREYLEILYKYYEKFDPEHREMVNANRNPRIEISQIFMTRSEFINKYGRRFGPLMEKKLKPSSLDSIKMKVVKGWTRRGKPDYARETDGSVMIRTLGQIKEMYILSEMNDDEKVKFFGKNWRHMFLRIPGVVTEMGKGKANGILTYHIKEAEKISRKGRDELNLPENITKQQRSIPIIGRGNTLYSTSKLVEAEATAIDSMIRSHYLKRLMAPLDWILSRYIEEGVNPESRGLNSIAAYLKAWGEYQLYNIKPEDQLFLKGKTISDIVDFANRVNSLNKIMFSPITQVNNLLIGQTFDLIREPHAVKTGIKRLFGGDGFVYNTEKIKNILRRYQLANITQDALFDQLEKEYRILFGAVDVQDIEKYGYMPMEFVEKVNQFVIFIGLMTDEEWNAYDKKGNTKPGQRNNKLTYHRLSLIEGRVKDIHGDYGKLSAAPFWATNTGKGLLQFRKWLPALLWAQFAPYHLDRNMQVRSGILPTLHILGKMIVYNAQNTAKRQKELQDEIFEANESGEGYSDAWFAYTDEYFDTLIEAVNGGKIKIKDLSDSDKRNLISAIAQVVSYIAITIGSTMLLGGDDNDRYQPFWKRQFMQIFNRYSGDVFFVFSMDNWKYFQENLVPALGLLINGSQFLLDIAYAIKSMFDPTYEKKARYNKDTMLATQGTYKFPISSTYVLPSGSAIRYMTKRWRIHSMRNNYPDLKKFDLDDEDLKEMGINSNLSEFDIIENSYKYKKVYKDMKLSSEYNVLKNKGIDPGTYLDAQIGESLLREEGSRLEDALKMMTLQRLYDQGDLGDYDQMLKDATKMRKIKAGKVTDKKSEQKRNFEEAIETLNNK